MGEAQNPKNVIIITIFRPEQAKQQDFPSVFVTRNSDILNSSRDQQYQIDTPAVRNFGVELLLLL